MRAPVFAALCGAALAQDPNVYGGAWELVTGAVGNPPTGNFGHATWVPGSLLIAGNDTTQVATGAIDLWKYNIVQSACRRGGGEGTRRGGAI